MVTNKDLRYIKTCLANNRNLVFAESKLMEFIREDENNPKLYYTLASFKQENDEKRMCYEKALELDPNYANAYYGFFLCDIYDYDYSSAKENLSIYKELMKDNKDATHCDMVLYEILLDELLCMEGKKVEDESECYEVDEYFHSQKLKGDTLASYYHIFEFIQEDDYESAYLEAKWIEDTEKNVNMHYVLSLLEEINKRRNLENPFVKIKTIDEEKNTI